ncbi:hypothetical protein D9M68_383210 [compost metagenome]
MMSDRTAWLLRLQELAVRHSHMGLVADLTALSIIELLGHLLLPQPHRGGA